MKRQQPEKYPDFTELYNDLNTRYNDLNILFYEKVASQIPPEVWTRVLESLHRNDRLIRYSHEWVKWTTVSKIFYNAVYQMRQIFMDTPLFPKDYITRIVDPSAVLSRFTNLEHLTIPCPMEKLNIPFLPCLKKLKIRHANLEKGSLAEKYCSTEPDLSLFTPEKLPMLEYLSFGESCLKSWCIPLSKSVRKQIKKININEKWGTNDLEFFFPNVTFIKCLSGTFTMSEKFSLKLCKIHCTKNQRLGKFSGVCRVYRKRKGTKSYLSSTIVSGKRIGNQ